MQESEQSVVQQVAANYMAQYTDEDFYVLQESQDRLKAHIEASIVSTLQFAEENTGQEIKVKPGLPDQPSKPRV